MVVVRQKNIILASAKEQTLGIGIEERRLINSLLKDDEVIIYIAPLNSVSYEDPQIPEVTHSVTIKIMCLIGKVG